MNTSIVISFINIFRILLHWLNAYAYDCSDHINICAYADQIKRPMFEPIRLELKMKIFLFSAYVNKIVVHSIRVTHSIQFECVAGGNVQPL